MAPFRWALVELAEAQDGGKQVGDAPRPLRHQVRHLLELRGEDRRWFSISSPGWSEHRDTELHSQSTLTHTMSLVSFLYSHDY